MAAMMPLAAAEAALGMVKQIDLYYVKRMGRIPQFIKMFWDVLLLLLRGPLDAVSIDASTLFAAVVPAA